VLAPDDPPGGVHLVIAGTFRTSAIQGVELPQRASVGDTRLRKLGAQPGADGDELRPAQRDPVPFDVDTPSAPPRASFMACLSPPPRQPTGWPVSWNKREPPP
jgi:hypothetical protein